MAVRRSWIWVMAAAALISACQKKAERQAEAPPAQVTGPVVTAPKAQFAAVSPDECALAAAYARTDGFAMPLKVNVAASPADAAEAADLTHAFPALPPEVAADLAGKLTAKSKSGSSLACDWGRLGAPVNRFWEQGDIFTRVLTAVSADGQTAVLDVLTNAADAMRLGVWCLYGKEAGQWVRRSCAPTVLG